MRRTFIVLVILVGVFFISKIQPANAGSCKAHNGQTCWSDEELNPPTDPLKVPPGGWTPQRLCSSVYYFGIYDPDGICPTPANATTLCCILPNGTCQQPDAQGQCTALLSQPSTLPCSELVCNSPIVQGTSETTGIRFKPQIPLPGSELFNGQEIIITGSTLGEYIAALYVFVVSAIGILAAVLIFYGGLMWLTAGGDRGRVQNAKDQIASAVIGILLAFGAYLLLLTISPKLVKFSSLEIKTVPKREAAYEKEAPLGAHGGGMGSIPIGNMDNWMNDLVNGMRAKYGILISSLATTQVPEDLIYAIIFVESGGRTSLKSSAGACGIMQLLPATAGKTCEQLYDPTIGITAGVEYLKKLASDTCPDTAIRRDGSVAQCKPKYVQSTNCSNGNVDFMIPAYNGGQGANCGSVDCPGKTWWECSTNTGYQETRDYYLKVKAAMDAINAIP